MKIAFPLVPHGSHGDCALALDLEQRHIAAVAVRNQQLAQEGAGAHLAAGERKALQQLQASGDGFKRLPGQLKPAAVMLPAKTVAGADPIFALKGIKNPTELENIRECHVRDGVAVVRFQMDLEKALAEGKQLTEIDIDTMLQKRRAEMPGYFEDSFSTIAAYGANAAMMHYHAEGDVNSVIEPRGFLLVDNGGQYDCGTTDITRTYPVGPLTDNERRYYTWVLQSHIDMARAVFLDYCTGFALDTFARGPVWAHKVNYRCGTGHGVGFISGVHEGPQSLRPNNPVIFKPGMTITDEPGIYETDEVGIRIENELECIDLGENQYGHWLGFAPLTLVPISTEPVLVDELSRDQINWLNDYHAHVYEMLSPRLNEDEKVWLKEKCAPLAR